MTDLKPAVSALLVDVHQSNPIAKHVVNLQRTLDTFLSEAQRINKSVSALIVYLRGIRQPYLSTTPPPRRGQHARQVSQSQTHDTGDIPTFLTDPQREDIDTQTTTLLRDLSSSISSLHEAAKLAHETAQQRLDKKYGKSTNFLMRWAAGDQNDKDAGKSPEQISEEGIATTTFTFRQGVLSYLEHRLKYAVEQQQGMLAIRAEREREKKASVLYDEANRHVKLQRTYDESLEDPWADGMNKDIDTRDYAAYNPALQADPAPPGFDLTPEQLQLFEEENNALLNHYQDQLAQATQAEKSLMEISSLQQQLVGHLSVQNETIDLLVADAERTDENVQKGNKELKRATERSSTARLVYYGTLGVCGTLIVWDLIF